MNDNDKTFHNSILGPVETSFPKDYVTPEERMKQALRSGPLPRAERRRAPRGALFCALAAMLWGAFIGAGLMAWYLL